MSRTAYYGVRNSVLFHNAFHTFPRKPLISLIKCHLIAIKDSEFRRTVSYVNAEIQISA